MTKNITNRQMFLIILLTLSSFSVVNIAKDLAEHAGTGSWFPVIVTTLFFAFSVSIIVRLNYSNKNKILCEYSKNIVGTALTYIISLYYFIFFFLIVVFLILQISIILQANYLQTTPIWATMLIGIPVFWIIAYKGINTIARMFEIFGVVYFVLGLAIISLIIGQGHFHRILPLFNPGEIKKYITSIKYAIFPFLGTEALLFIPFNKRNGKKSIRTAFFAIVVTGVFYILVIYTNIMQLGLNSIVYYKDTVIVVLRDIDVPVLDFLKRLDFIFLTIGFIGIFMSISLLCTVLVEIILKLFKKLKRLSVVITLGILTYIICFSVSKFSTEYIKFIRAVGSIYGLTTSFLIPTILYIIYKIKDKKHIWN